MSSRPRPGSCSRCRSPACSLIALGNGTLLRGRAAGWVGTAAIGLAFVFALITFFKLQDLPAEERVVTSSLWDLVNVAGVHIQSRHLRRPAVDADDPDRQRGLGADPPLLGRLHGLRPRLRALLRVPELLRLLDAAAGARGQPRAADRRLGVRRRGELHADLVLVPAHDRDQRGHQGVRDQRRRRRRPRARHVLHLPRDGRARLHAAVRRRAATCSRSNDPSLVAG